MVSRRLEFEGVVDLNIKRIYTIDEELKRRAKDFDVTHPIPSDVMRKYHEYVEKRIKT